MLSFDFARFGVAAAMAAALLQAALPARAAETVVHFFGADVGDGQSPEAGLINVGGTLYGTTFGGGDYGFGTVFSVTPAGVEKVVYSFRRVKTHDGEIPQAGLINVGGRLYGTTINGGDYGSGTVFSVTPAGVEKVVYSFGRGRDGFDPQAGLINVGGTLYGTTALGGGSSACTEGCGTVFSVTPAGVEKVLHSFTGSGVSVVRDGAAPSAGLINVGGTLYGTTVAGGHFDAVVCGCFLGTVFSVTPAGVEKVVYAFKGLFFRDGGRPRAGLINVGGTLYGTTFGGGDYGFGTVFSVTPAGVEKVVYSFKGTAITGVRDSANPAAGLINVGGTLYGTTSLGGDSGWGTVFSVTPAGVEKVVYSFKGPSVRDGGNPYAGLINVGGTLYGTTAAGGGAGGRFCSTPASGCGTVFKIAP